MKIAILKLKFTTNFISTFRREIFYFCKKKKLSNRSNILASKQDSCYIYSKFFEINNFSNTKTPRSVNAEDFLLCIQPENHLSD